MARANGAMMAKMITCRCIMLAGEYSGCGGFGAKCEMFGGVARS